VVENYRPDVKYRLGVDYESLAAINPRVVLASISGFGQDGPYRDRPGFDQIAQGMSGMMSVTGKPGEGPMRAGAAIDDMAAGLYAALGVLTALLEREASGRGQWVQSVAAARGHRVDGLPGRALPDRRRGSRAGRQRPPDQHADFGLPDRGRPHQRRGGRAGDVAQAVRGGPPPRSARARGVRHGPGRSANRSALNAELARIFSSAPSDEWIERLNAAGIPCGPILSVDKVFADPQVQHLGIATPVQHPTLGEIRVIGQAATLSRTPARLTSALPAAGAHNDEILGELGYPAQRIAQWRSEGVI